MDGNGPPEPPLRRERSEDSVMEGLPQAKAERVASMRRELADLQRQLIEAQQRIATELQGRAEDAERYEALEARANAQELESQHNATRVTELETELSSVRTQLASANAAAQQLEAKTSALDEANALLQARDAELTARTTERDAEQAIRSRLEHELEDQRSLQRKASEELEAQRASSRDTQALLATRDAELAAMTSERDGLKRDLDQVRRELDAARVKARDVANQLARVGQELVDGVVAARPGASSEPKPGPGPEPSSAPGAEPSSGAGAAQEPVVARPNAERPQPPPVPRRTTAHAEPQPIETIIEVVEARKPSISRFGAGLLMLGGVILGSAVTIAFAKASSPDSTGADQRQDLVPLPSAAIAAPLAMEHASNAAPDTVTRVEAERSAPSEPGGHAPTSEPDVTARAGDEAGAPATSTTTGVILLPAAADGHRVFVDGKVVPVKSSRAVVPCGTREVRIGSRGTARTFDVACGGETAISEP